MYLFFIFWISVCNTSYGTRSLPPRNQKSSTNQVTYQLTSIPMYQLTFLETKWTVKDSLKPSTINQTLNKQPRSTPVSQVVANTSLKQRSLWETNSRSARQEIPLLLWNPRGSHFVFYATLSSGLEWTTVSKCFRLSIRPWFCISEMCIQM